MFYLAYKLKYWNGRGFDSLCSLVSEKMTVEEIEIFVAIAWSLWQSRNIGVYEAKWRCYEGVLESAGSLLRDYQLSNKVEIAPKQPFLSKDSSWKEPPPGCLKLNVDAAVKTGFGYAGIGAVIRDAAGVVVSCLSKRVAELFSPHVAEFIAMREGLEMATTCGLVVESVESGAVNIEQGNQLFLLS